MNRRNVSYIGENNKRSLYPLVDNKLKTKLLAEQHGIASPKLLGVVEFQHHVNQLPEFLDKYDDFVIKPARGSGGKGILVITEKDGVNFLKPSGAPVTPSELQRYASNILSGMYSLGGTPDVAIIEELIIFDEVFEGYSYEGVPDIRVVTYKGYPAMAMTRLSTKASDGKANLHQGAVGVGLDLGTGKALNAVQYDRPIEHHPDTGIELKRLQVPHWDKVLQLSSHSFEITTLGYLGVDVILDKHRGPMVIELNARPGLAIQIANGHGLDGQIKKIEADLPSNRSLEGRAEFARNELSLL